MVWTIPTAFSILSNCAREVFPKLSPQHFSRVQNTLIRLESPAWTCRIQHEKQTFRFCHGDGG